MNLPLKPFPFPLPSPLRSCFAARSLEDEAARARETVSGPWGTSDCDGKPIIQRGPLPRHFHANQLTSSSVHVCAKICNKLSFDISSAVGSPSLLTTNGLSEERLLSLMNEGGAERSRALGISFSVSSPAGVLQIRRPEAWEDAKRQGMGNKVLALGVARSSPNYLIPSVRCSFESRSLLARAVCLVVV